MICNSTSRDSPGANAREEEPVPVKAAPSSAAEAGGADGAAEEEEGATKYRMDGSELEGEEMLGKESVPPGTEILARMYVSGRCPVLVKVRGMVTTEWLGREEGSGGGGREEELPMWRQGSGWTTLSTRRSSFPYTTDTR